MAENRKISNKVKFKLLAMIGFFAFLSQVILGFFVLLNQKKIKIFWRQEKKELTDLISGKESSMTFASKTFVRAKNLFIPTLENNFKPKVLRPKSLIFISSAAIILKIFLTLVLFFTYPSSAEFSAIVSSNMIAQINKSRAESNLLPLRENLNLTSFAYLKGQDMMNRDYFAHDTPEGKRPWEFIDKSKYDYVYAGENLAIDFSTSEAVHEAFMNSPSHKRNILNPKYLDVGVAVLNGTMSGHKTILLVEFFGTQRKDLALLDGSNSTSKSIQTAAVPASAKQTETTKQTVAKPTTPTKPVVTTKPVTVDTKTPEIKKVTVAPEPVPTNTIVPTPQTAGVSEEEILPEVKEQEVEPNSVSNEVLPETPAISPDNAVIIKEATLKNSLADRILEYSNIFFLAFLIFMVISLGLNIFVRIKIQDPGVILQSLAVIALLAALLIVKFHFSEQVTYQTIIL